MAKPRFTFKQFQARFPDDDACLAEIFRRRYGTECECCPSFWSHLKRGIKSTHASVSKKHIQKYVDEFVFRYNHRDEPAEMFNRVLAQISKPVEKR